MKNITILAVALMGVTVSACGDKKTKMTKTLTADCGRVIATMEAEGEDVPAGFCQCFSEKIVATLAPDDLTTVMTLFSEAQNEQDIEAGFKNLNDDLMESIDDIPDQCGM